MNAGEDASRQVALKARYVFPVAGPPIPDGVVTINGDRVVAVGKTAACGEVRDLGNAAILPGLVNAHTHLEFSDLSQPVGRPGMGFVEWIEAVIQTRRQKAESGRSPVELGLEEVVRCGTTALGEIAQPGWKSEPFKRAPLDATIFLELIAPTESRIPAAIEAAQLHTAQTPSERQWIAGLCPHAPYSVHPELLRRIVQEHSHRPTPIALHLAESKEELEFLRFRTGPFRAFLERIEGWEPSSIPLGTRPLDYLRLLGTAQRALVIHGNYLDNEEIGLLAQRSDRMAVVYCPRTHAYFGHDEYPLARYLSAGVSMALGTDSRASTPDLSLLAEMRFLARRGQIPLSRLLQLGTLDGACALGLDAHSGSLAPGKFANLAVVALPDREASDPHELLFDSDAPIVKRWYRGHADFAGGVESPQ